MKFLECSQCFSGYESRQEVVQEVCDPLVITKRPASTQTDMTKRKSSSLLRSWRNSLTDQPRRSAKNVRKVVRVIEPPRRSVPTFRRPLSKTQRLIRMYENQTKSGQEPVTLDCLIEPPEGFGGPETHRNFQNKLNSLDFRRMNTVALAADDEKPIPISRFAKKIVLEDWQREKMKIERSTVDLLCPRKSARFQELEAGREVRVDVAGSSFARRNLEDDGRLEQETEISLRIEPGTEIEEFYVEKTTTYLKDKTVEDKSLVLTIANGNKRQRMGEQVIEEIEKLSLQG